MFVLKNKIYSINNPTINILIFGIKTHSFVLISIFWWLLRCSCFCMTNPCIWSKIIQEISIVVHVNAELLRERLVSVYKKPWRNICLMSSEMVAIWNTTQVENIHLVRWLAWHSYLYQPSFIQLHYIWSVSLNTGNDKYLFKKNGNKMNNKRCILFNTKICLHNICIWWNRNGFNWEPSYKHSFGTWNLFRH